MQQATIDLSAWKEVWSARLVPAEGLRLVLQHPKSVLGCDVSSLHTAMVLTKDESLFKPTLRKEERRREDLLRLKDELKGQIESIAPDFVSVEDYSYQSNDNFKAIQIVEYSTTFRLAVAELRIPLIKVAVPRVKSFAKPVKGVGKETVQEFIQAIIGEAPKEWGKNRLGQTGQTVYGDICDACTIALAGKFAVAFLENPALETHFPAQFIRIFRNRDGNGIVDILRAEEA